MTTNRKNQAPGPDPANDNTLNPAEGAPIGTFASPAAGAGGTAIASIAALGSMLERVDLSSGGGGGGMPMLFFKARAEPGRNWVYGQKQLVLEPGVHVAVNPTSFRWGRVAFDNDNKPTERLCSVGLPMPENPDDGRDWTPQWTAAVKVTTGPDSGAEFVFKSNTVGGIDALKGLINEVRTRITGGRHDGNVVPIVELGHDSYQHPQYGRIATPVLKLVGWMPFDGPSPPPGQAKPPLPSSPPPAPAAAAAEAPRGGGDQPRRRRVG
jgi:hypothetical protein